MSLLNNRWIESLINGTQWHTLGNRQTGTGKKEPKHNESKPEQSIHLTNASCLGQKYLPNALNINLSYFYKVKVCFIVGCSIPHRLFYFLILHNLANIAIMWIF